MMHQEEYVFQTKHNKQNILLCDCARKFDDRK